MNNRNENGSDRLFKPWPIEPVFNYTIMAICELRTLILTVFVLLFYDAWFLFWRKFCGNFDFVKKVTVKIFLWFLGVTSGEAQLVDGEFSFFVFARLLGYLFLGIIVFAVTSSIKKLSSELAKNQPKIPNVRDCLNVCINSETKAKNKLRKTSMTKKVLLPIFLIIFLFLPIFYSCQNKESEELKKDVHKEIAKLRAVELPITYSAVTYIAYAKGYISEEGIDYKVISVTAGPDIINGLRGGGDKAADLGSIAVTPIIVMVGAGDHPIVLATTIKSNVRVQLVTFTGTGITDDPTTLKGKKVGYVGSTVGEIYLSRLLKKAGMTEKDLQAVNGRPADIKSLLLRRDIDAAILWDPFVSQAIRQGKEIKNKEGQGSLGDPVVYVDPSLYTLTFNIVTTKSKLDNYRSELVKFIRACIKAGDFIQDNPEEARRMLEEWLNLEDGDLKNFIETTSFDVHLDVQQIKNDMQLELDWLKERQPSTIIPKDFSPYIDTSLLKEIDSTRVKD